MGGGILGAQGDGTMQAVQRQGVFCEVGVEAAQIDERIGVIGAEGKALLIGCPSLSQLTALVVLNCLVEILIGFG